MEREGKVLKWLLRFTAYLFLIFPSRFAFWIRSFSPHRAETWSEAAITMNDG
jgi:hypothetical protein